MIGLLSTGASVLAGGILGGVLVHHFRYERAYARGYRDGVITHLASCKPDIFLGERYLRELERELAERSILDIERALPDLAADQAADCYSWISRARSDLDE